MGLLINRIVKKNISNGWEERKKLILLRKKSKNSPNEVFLPLIKR